MAQSTVDLNTSFNGNIINAIQNNSMSFEINWKDANGNPIDVQTGNQWAFEVKLGSKTVFSINPVTFGTTSKMIISRTKAQMNISAQTYAYHAIRLDSAGNTVTKLNGAFIIAIK